MNINLKNIFSFIKETLELKNKNIYDLDNYEISIDFSNFYSKYKLLIDVPDYKKININSDGVIFKLKYISEKNKKSIPEIPVNLKKYISINKNKLEPLIDDLEMTLKSEELLLEYKQYENSFNNIKEYNNLISEYNKLYLEFYNIYKRINDYEEKIEVVFGQKLLIWSNNDEHLKRYILEATLDMQVDPTSNTIIFTINKEKFRGFVTDFLNINSYKIKEIAELSKFVNEFNDLRISDEFNLNEEAAKYINYISLENEIYNRDIELNEKIEILKTYLFDNSGIIVRKKNVKLWIDDVQKIIDDCNNVEFNSPVFNLLQTDFSDEEKVNSILRSNENDEEVLFPLPANKEQYEIVDKVKSSNVVLVQGPPGTGKSHTIANLLSHFISVGKRVIVTSEKAKALEVLRDKIPENIRSLSLALLAETGTNNELEKSIDKILKKYNNDNLKEIESEIIELTQKLKDIQKEKRDNNNKIIELNNRDTISHREELNKIIKFNGTEDLTLMDIAKWLSDYRIYKFIPLEDENNYFYPNIQDFLASLDIYVEDIRNNNYTLLSKVPINKYLNNNEIELYIKENNNYKHYQLYNRNLQNFLQENNITEEKVTELEKIVNKLNILYNFFQKDLIIKNKSYEVFNAKVKEMYDYLKEQHSFILETEKDLYNYSVKIINDNPKYLNTVNEILLLYKDKETLSFINSLKYKNIIKNLEGLYYNESVIDRELSKSDFVKIKNALQYLNIINKIDYLSKQVLHIDFFAIYKISKKEFGRIIDNVINILEVLVNYDSYVTEIDIILKELININLFPISYTSCSLEDIKGIVNDLKYYVNVKQNSSKTNNIIKDIREYYQEYSLRALNDLLNSIQNNDEEKYISSKNKLLNEIKVINNYNELKEKYNNLIQEKEGFINNYIYKYTREQRQFIKSNIDIILRYHYIEKYYLFLESKNNNLPALYEKREELIKEEKNIISFLIEKKGWYFQNLRMNANIQSSLAKWLDLKRKYGKGTGKNANNIARQMQNEMFTAKNAIPVWIMPIDKLIEQYPFSNEPPFDVLIMDESSQSSVLAISALARAKKVIIVGDEKQISPTNAFTSIDDINDLETKYLKNSSWRTHISRDTSIYDLIRIICGSKKITLTEHFRCLPEIINYSNKQFYNMEINPLKVRSAENTIKKPIMTIYVEDAYCQRKGTNIYNEKEIEKIVECLSEITNDEQYNNKSIGIIALQNSNIYIQKLTEIIMRKFGEDFINERKIKVGTTYDFQGDERDVIILGMVIARLQENGERYNFTALTREEFNRSFNVAASRAKEQMILVHSVKLEDLSPECNRYKLLNYCLNYDNEQEKENEKLFESGFERDVYNCLTKENYKLIPQFKVGKYRIDLVLENNNNQKIAIECDGDTYHTLNNLEQDLERQSILERCGWKFIRIRASEFYYNKNDSINKMITKIEGFLNNNDSINYQNNDEDDGENNNNDDLSKTKDDKEKSWEDLLNLS